MVFYEISSVFDNDNRAVVWYCMYNNNISVLYIISISMY